MCLGGIAQGEELAGSKTLQHNLIGLPIADIDDKTIATSGKQRIEIRKQIHFADRTRYL